MSYKASKDQAPSSSKSWAAFTRELAKDSRLWLWAVFLLFIGRATLIGSNQARFADSNAFPDYAEVFITGFRFDMPVATLITFPSLVCSCLCTVLCWQKIANILRSFTISLFIVLWTIITTVTLGYFNQYHNQFDAHLLGVVYDDFGAIVETIWQGYPIIRGLLVMLCVITFLIWLGRKWISKPYPFPSCRAPRHIIAKLAVVLLILSTFALGLRGSWGRRPMQMKDAAQTEDFVLNKCVINPFTALVYAIKAHKELMGTKGLDSYLKKENLLSAFQEFAGGNNLSRVDDAFLRTAEGRPGEKPQHIFLILMESYDGWTMLDKHADWDISNELKALGKEGISVRRFLPASRSTMKSMASIITGLADAGVITNERYRPGSPPYSTAIATQMKRLGYDTHLYYAGYGGWHRIEDFAIEQGFDHTHMGSSMDGGADTNEWGVTDKVLFSYIAEHFQTEKPTFNLILTSSNHPPYTVDLAKENCPVKEVPTKYQEGFDDGNASIEMLGHHWYSDHYLGKFVKQVASQEKGCLFAITGDHWGRIFPGPRPTFFEQAIVPLVLYGPDVLPKNIDPDKLSGSHYDLGATLIELSAEAGHQYHAMGNNILASSDKDIAISRLWYLGKDFILPASNDGSPQTLRGEKMNTPETFKAVRHHYNLMHGISWWRICEGNELPKE